MKLQRGGKQRPYARAPSLLIEGHQNNNNNNNTNNYRRVTVFYAGAACGERVPCGAHISHDE